MKFCEELRHKPLELRSTNKNEGFNHNCGEKKKSQTKYQKKNVVWKSLREFDSSRRRKENCAYKKCVTVNTGRISCGAPSMNQYTRPRSI